MPETTSAAYDALLGALIGLARTARTNPMTENTPHIALRALCDLTFAPDNADALALHTRFVHEEKDALSPGCARCPSPCGANFDYEMTLLRTAPPETQAAKALLLSAILGAAPRMLARNLTDDAAQAAAALLLDGLFLLADERPGTALLPEILKFGGRLSEAGY